jgi:hypothetical protein
MAHPDADNLRRSHLPELGFQCWGDIAVFEFDNVVEYVEESPSSKSLHGPDRRVPYPCYLAQQLVGDIDTSHASDAPREHCVATIVM